MVVRAWLFAALGLASCAAAPKAAATKVGATAGTISVPIDRSDPKLGNATLDYELGAPFDPAKPIAFVVADGQQFYMKKGAMPGLQAELAAGHEVNVVGLIGRGSTQAFIDAALDANKEPNWPRAWRIFRAEEWLDDLDQLRVELGGRDARVILYGVSGGAFLAHQYLARHGEHVERAFTAAAVQPFIVGDIGANTDRFWEEIGEHDHESQSLITKALADHPSERFTIAMLLQRQNFFVPPAALGDARAEVIRELAAWDEAKLAKRRTDYQVDAIRELFESNAAIPSRVREFEFAWPARESERLGRAEFRPDLEVHAFFAKPLYEALEAKAIEPPSFDFAALHRLGADVLVVAGHEDHTVDYRTSIALAAHYPRGRVILLADDHMFGGAKADGSLVALTQAFIAHGSNSAEFETALAKLAPHRWKE